MALPPHKDYSLNHSQIYLSGLSHVWESCLDPEELSNHQSLKSLPHKVSRLKLVPEIFKVKGQNYHKTRPQQGQEKHYLEQLLKRIQEKPEQMQTFTEFIKFCKSIKINSSL